MKKDAIVQFVCFETVMNFEEFILKWEHYSKQLVNISEVTLQQEVSTKVRFKYVSQHKMLQNNFQFVFMKGRKSVHFPESDVKVVQAGGYVPIQAQCMHDSYIDETKILVFLNDDEIDVKSYKQVDFYQYLNIYQSFYESCRYNYIMEYFVEHIHVSNLIHQLNTINPAVEIGCYKECLILDMEIKKDRDLAFTKGMEGIRKLRRKDIRNNVL